MKKSLIAGSLKNPLNGFKGGNNNAKQDTKSIKPITRKVIFRRKITGPCNTNPHVQNIDN